MVTEKKKMASQLTAVQNLGLQLQKKEQQVKLLIEKTERLEGSLARAENRIAQLSLQTRNGQNALAGEGAIVNPGVSKKVLEALSRENTKRRQAFDHLSSRGQSGVNLVVENRDLHEIIMTLREERDMKSNEVSELKKVLTALQNQVMCLRTQVTKLERNLNAKQVFCETIVTENEELKTELQSLKDGKFMKVREMKKELGDLTKTQPEVREIIKKRGSVTYSTDRENEGEQKQDVYKSLMVETYQLHDSLSMHGTEGKQMASQSAAGDENHHPDVQTKAQSKNKLLLEECKQLEAFLVRSENKLMQMRSPADNCCRPRHLFTREEAIVDPDSSKKVLEALTSENRKLKKAVDYLTKKGSSGVDLAVRGEAALTGATQMINRELEEKEAQLVELQMELELLKKAFAVYEDDFKSEREERVKALSDQEKITRERDHLSKSQKQLMRENTALREDIELMCQQLASYEDDFKSERVEKIKALSDREKIKRERDRYIHEELKKEEQHLALAENMKQSKVARRYRRPGYRGTSEAQQDELLCPRSRTRETDSLALGQDFSDYPPNPSRETPRPSPQRYKEEKKRKLERGSTKSLSKRDRQISGAALETPCCSKHCFGSHCSAIVTMIVPVRPET